MSDKHIDEVSGVETTGHEWDGIRELNNPLPRWWVWTFYATHRLGARLRDRLSGLAAAAPRRRRACSAIPAAATSKTELAARRGARRHLRRPDRGQDGRPRSSPTTTLRAIRDRRRCARPSRSTASSATARARRVRPAIPNLNDDDWLWGGTPEQIQHDHRHGIRFAGDRRHAHLRDAGLRATSSTATQIGAGRRLCGRACPDRRRTPALVEPGKTGLRRQLRRLPWRRRQGQQGARRAEPDRRDLAARVRARTAIVAQVAHPEHGVMPAWAGAPRRRQRSRSWPSMCIRWAAANSARGALLPRDHRQRRLRHMRRGLPSHSG